MDLVDATTEQTGVFFQEALSRARAAAVRLAPRGDCYNCGDILLENCFCDDGCRDDYEFRERMRKIGGVE